MEIILARGAGFCPGVDRAAKMAQEAALDGKTVQTFGPLMHNSEFTKHLESKGITIANSIQEITAEKIVIRAHGIPKDVEKQLKDKGLEIVDATCTFVKRVQTIADELTNEGYKVLILGEDDHPEIIGLKSYAPGCYVVQSKDNLPVFDQEEKVGFISQTTQSVRIFEEISEMIQAKYENHKIVKTICGTTGMRQKAAQELAGEVDLMIIVGGKDSSNTTRLKEVCEKKVTTYHIESENELNEEWFQGIQKVGISAGASTPYFSIEAVIGWLHLRFDAKLI